MSNNNKKRKLTFLEKLVIIALVVIVLSNLGDIFHTQRGEEIVYDDTNFYIISSSENELLDSDIN